MNITVSTNELYVKGGKSGVEIVTFTSTEPIQVTYEQITNGLNGYTRVSIVDNFTTNVTWKIEYSGLNVHNEIYKGEIRARLTGSDEELVVPVTIDCSVPSTNRIETTCKTLYVKGEKNGTETVVFTCAEPIEVTYEQFTNNLNGNVRVWIENNFTNEVTWNVEYSDLYLYGETYSGLIHARLSGDVDSLDVPVVVNCSDTLIYSDVPNDTVIEVEEGIHITYSSLPEVNKVWIVFEDGTETDITDLLNGQTIDLTYEYLLNQFGVADYDYICATNGLSQITHKLNKVVYKLEIIGAAFKRIDWKMQRVSFILRSTRNNKSCGFDVSASDGSKVDVFYINGDTGIYKISCLVDGNGLDIEREIILNVVQKESKYEVQFKILQGVYVLEGNEFIYRAETPTANRLYNWESYDTDTTVVANVIDAFLDDIPYDDYEFDGIVGVKYNYKFKVSGSNYARLFRGCPIYKVVKFDTSKAENMEFVFSGCSSLTSIPLIDTSKVKRTRGMFSGCSSLTSIPLLDISKVTDIRNMFYGCSSLTTIPQLNTSSALTMSNMFYGCSSLTTIPQLNTSKNASMFCMFYNCQSLTTIPPIDTSNVADMTQSFNGCSSLTSIPLLDTSNVVLMGYTYDGCFGGCSSLTNVGGFKKLKVDLDLSDSPLLTHESLMNVINNLASGANKTLSLGKTNLAKLTAEEKRIAINKGWVLS